MTAVTAARKDSQLICRVPLPGKSERVTIALKYLYQDSMPLESFADAEEVAVFAHKYDMPQVLELCNSYLVANFALPQGPNLCTAFKWAQFAEKHHLKEFLAHCEQYIAMNYHRMSPEQKKLSTLSIKSIQRVMDCFGRDSCLITNIATKKGTLGYYSCCQTLSFSLMCPVCSSLRAGGVEVSAIDKGVVSTLMGKTVPAVTELLNWQDM